MEITMSKAPVVAMAIGLATFGAGTVAMPAEAHAATGIKTVYNWDFNKHWDKTKTVPDITGDGEKDKVRFVFKREYPAQDGSSSFTMYVNGKKAYHTNKGYGGYMCTVKRIKLASGKPLVYVKYTGDGDDGVYSVLRYEKGELKKLVTNNIADGMHSSYITKLKVDGNKLTVDYSTWLHGLGLCKFDYVYNYQKGELKRTSSTVSNLDYSNGSETDKQPLLTLCAKTEFYKSPAADAETTALAKGCQLKLTEAKKKGRQLWFKAQVEKSGDSLWLKIPKNYLSDYDTYHNGTYFIEKYMAG